MTRRILHTLVLAAAGFFVAFLAGCEEKINQPDYTNDLVGTWELFKAEMAFPDSTATLSIGIDYPMIFRIFDKNGAFEQIENDFDGQRYSNNQWAFQGDSINIRLTSGPAENWKFSIATDTLVLSRRTIKDSKLVTITHYFKRSPKTDFKNDEKFLATWEMNSYAEIYDDSVYVTTPDESGIKETLLLQAPSAFTETVNNKGSIREISGSWAASYYLIILKYATGSTKVYVFENDGSKLVLENTSIANGKRVLVRKEYAKK